LLPALSLVLLIAASACSRDDLSLGDGRPDAGAGGGAPAGGAGGDGGAPAILPPFSEPTMIAALSASEDGNDDDPSLTADLTEIYFNSDRTGSNEDIWRSVRANETDDWPAPEAVDVLNSPDRETGIALAADGLTVWFSSDRGGAGLDIYVARRDQRSDEWLSPELEEALSTSDDDLVSSISADGLTIYLARRTDDSDDYDVFVAQRDTVADDWQPAAALSEVNTDAAESDASPVQGGLVLLFTRSEDLYVAERSSSGGLFSNPTPIEALNSESDDRDAWATHDFGYVVFSSDREGRYQLFQARR